MAMIGKRGRFRRTRGVIGAFLGPALGAALLLGCPSGGRKKPEVRYEVRELTPEEKAARKERMKGNRHTQAQLFRDLRRLRRPPRGR